MADVYDLIDKQSKPRQSAVLEIPRPRPPLGPLDAALIAAAFLVLTYFILSALVR